MCFHSSFIYIAHWRPSIRKVSGRGYYWVRYLTLARPSMSSLTIEISLLKVSKSRKQFLVFSIPLKKMKNGEKNILRALKIFFFVFRSFFGRIENSKNCFRDLLTFSYKLFLKNAPSDNISPNCDASCRKTELATQVQFIFSSFEVFHVALKSPYTYILDSFPGRTHMVFWKIWITGWASKLKYSFDCLLKISDGATW